MVYRKIVRIAKSERLISIADFVASRYGKSTGLGALTAIVLVVGTVPYIALQLKAVSSSFLTLWQSTHLEPLAADRVSLACAGVLALFAILFGTRSVDLTEQHAGLVLAIAFESLVKLVAFLAVGIFVVWGLFDGLGDIFTRAAAQPELAAMLSRSDASDGDWVWMTLLSLLAFWFLPRQFQVAVVENVDERHLRTSSWLLPLYLLVINLFVLPIALAGRLTLGEPRAPRADGYVLALPMLRRPGDARRAGLPRRPVGGDRHDHRGEPRAVEHGRQRPRAAGPAAPQGPVGGLPLSAPGQPASGDRRRRAARPSLRGLGDHRRLAGDDRPDLLRGGRAARSRHPRRALLDRRDPARRDRRNRRRRRASGATRCRCRRSPAGS